MSIQNPLESKSNMNPAYFVRQNHLPDRLAKSVERIKSSKIMIVDDEPLLVRVVQQFLKSFGYSDFVSVTDSRQAIQVINDEQPDVVLLDIMMPHVTGLEILRSRQKMESVQFVPFIVLTASDDEETKRNALELGATDILNKPLNRIDLSLRVQNALLVKAHQDHLQNYADNLAQQVLERTADLESSREQIIHCLAQAAEFRDNDTGKHVVRVGKFSAIIARELKFSSEFCEKIELAAQLHDVGKIGVPDAILLNPGKLSDEDFKKMQLHCNLGCRIIEPLAKHELAMLKRRELETGSPSARDASTLLIMAANIAKTHHENWDGTGYPNGLAGDQIPIEGRITAVADVYDALSSRRPYKEAFSKDKSIRIIQDEVGRRFDATVVNAFMTRIDEIEKTRIEYSD